MTSVAAASSTLLKRPLDVHRTPCDNVGSFGQNELQGPVAPFSKRSKSSVPHESPRKSVNASNGHARVLSGKKQVCEDSEEYADLQTLPDDTALRDSVPAHPLGIKPLGNLYSAAESNIRSHAGTLSRLPDELLTQVLECLGAEDLVGLGQTCKPLYAFCRHDELWRALFIERSLSTFQWRGTWRSTYLDTDSTSKPVSCAGLYSDALYRPFFCAHMLLVHYSRDIPPQNAIARLEDMSHAQFMEDRWAEKPFILTSPVKRWRAYQHWSKENLLRSHATTRFRAEAVDWPLEQYVRYMDHNKDESPLYLFDSHFVSKMSHAFHGNDNQARDCAPERSQSALSLQPEPHYMPPTAFGIDLFNHLGDSRPDNKWLILGPARSGSTFHKDPNGTSAWNAVLRGSKYWLMFPSTTATGKPLPPPPGVFLSPDGSEVTSPLSIAEYLLSFHAAARTTSGCQEGICNEGEVLHVPSGWYHLVMNLEENLAITQNFVPEAHLGKVLRFLRDTPEQISGFANDIRNEDVYDMFINSLRTQAPELLKNALEEIQKPGESRVGGSGKEQASSRWEDLTKSDAAGGFSFGFGGEDDVDAED